MYEMRWYDDHGWTEYMIMCCMIVMCVCVCVCVCVGYKAEAGVLYISEYQERDAFGVERLIGHLK